MKTQNSVYQSESYVDALNSSKENIKKTSDGLFFIERIIKLPIFGKRKIIEAKGTLSKEQMTSFRKVSEGYFYGTVAPCVLNTSDDAFTESGYAKVDNYTMLIDLTKSEEELWKELDKGSIRWGVGYAERNGLKASVAKAEEIDEFYKLYEETANTGRFTPESKDFVKRVAISDIGKLFVIKKDAKIVAGGLILVDEHNNYSILDLTSASESGLKLQAMPFLYWSLISYSKKRGLNYFDLGGFDREAKEGEKTHSINKFKERFGGKVVLQPIYATNWKYKLFRRILKRVRFMKGAYTKK